MSKSKLAFCLSVVVALIAVSIDFITVYKCSYENVKIGWGWAGLGAVLQVVGIAFFFLSLREGASIGGDYLRYGVFRSKWYYAVMTAIIGCVIFSYAINRYGENKNLELGRKWWSCPRL
ncbi:hypothetical protein [Ralstonia solanacearum]|uniref:hypothetical protein n=1 Tax=Ralstonia solanacearum TaxID=305 RepID=UPI0011C3898B|nr:hypothetical protein [Ralstonia solanacearum]